LLARLRAAHATLKCLRGVGSVKELRRDAQSANLVASGPSGTNLVSLTPHVAQRRKCANSRGLAWLEKKLDGLVRNIRAR
jgi:hypothetical protein